MASSVLTRLKFEGAGSKADIVFGLASIRRSGIGFASRAFREMKYCCGSLEEPRG